MHQGNPGVLSGAILPFVTLWWSGPRCLSFRPHLSGRADSKSFKRRNNEFVLDLRGDLRGARTRSGVPFREAEGRQMRDLAAEQAVRSKVLSNGWLGD